MMQNSIDRRQGHTRIVFDRHVQLVDEEDAQQLVGRANNLSESGVFVASPETFPVGTVICVEMEADPQYPLAVRGRVSRIKHGDSPGMGIEFVDLSETDRSVLRQTVMEGIPLRWTRAAKVWFEGTSHLTRAIAAMTPQGVALSAELGFLRLGSQLMLYFSDEEGQACQGILREVALKIRPEDGTPRLQLSVDLNSPPRQPAQTWTHWPPPPVRQADAPPLSTYEELVVIEPAELEPDEEIVDLVTPDIATTVSGSITARAIPAPPMPLEPSVETRADLLASASPSLPRVETACSSPWDAIPSPEPSHWAIRSNDLPQPQPQPRPQQQPQQQVQPRRRHRESHAWLWVAALLMTGIAVASMSHTGLLQQARDRLLSWAAGYPQADVSIPSVSRATALVPSAPPVPAPVPTPTPTPTPTPASVVSPPPAPSGPDLTLEENRSTVTVPISGSLSGATHYALADPAGIAINLPRATPGIPFGDYPTREGGFRMVWVRKRAAGGLHLRFLFSQKLTPKLRLEARAVHVDLAIGASSER